MWRRVLNYLLLALLWLGAGAVLLVGMQRAEQRRAARVITDLKIEIADSSSVGLLVSRKTVEQWLHKQRTSMEGKSASTVDLQGIEQQILKSGFVRSASCWVDYHGVLHIEIFQRNPLFRLLVEGYNHYITAEGYIFRAPHNSARHVPVITGSYQPPFPPDFEGWIGEHRQAMAQQSEERIAQIEREKYPLYEREKQNYDFNRETRRMFTRRRLLESRERFDARVRELRAEKQRRRQTYRYRRQQIEVALGKIDARQELVALQQKKLEKKYEDFLNLTTFVREIERDAFWRSEMVQILASEAHSGVLEVAFVPRSGNYLVELGRIEQMEQKLERLEEFLRDGPGPEQLSTYRTISLKFDERVVCRKR